MIFSTRGCSLKFGGMVGELLGERLQLGERQRGVVVLVPLGVRCTCAQSTANGGLKLERIVLLVW